MSFLRRLFGRDAPDGAAPVAPSEIFEASMNFDLENVRPFLERLRDRRGIGFDVDALVPFTSGTEVNEERRMAQTAIFNGREVSLRYGVFMDDIDAPDLYFFVPNKALVAAINAEWEDFTEELGI
ncbi:hypothetical protein [Erythrobacter donghaensis]|uniref:hypothetical protein n=1 Tax=Erythrobacter donghaensis TaxID=267135 RepID=UPI000A39CA57|nr:hypothetical protein [Erythrobacter donghaensis]